MLKSMVLNPGWFVLWIKTQGLSQETTLVLSNTRELDGVPNTK